MLLKFWPMVGVRKITYEVLVWKSGGGGTFLSLFSKRIPPEALFNYRPGWARKVYHPPFIKYLLLNRPWLCIRHCSSFYQITSRAQLSTFSKISIKSNGKQNAAPIGGIIRDKIGLNPVNREVHFFPSLWRLKHKTFYGRRTFLLLKYWHKLQFHSSLFEYIIEKIQALMQNISLSSKSNFRSLKKAFDRSKCWKFLHWVKSSFKK